MHCCFKKNEIILLLDNEKIKYPIDMQNGHWLKELFLAPSIFNIMFLIAVTLCLLHKMSAFFGINLCCFRLNHL